MSSRYSNSENFLNRAVQSIPLGTQTFSKSKTQYPVGVSPLYVTHAKGSRVWDVDGNEYIDFVNGLAAITIGHCDEDVSHAVKEQIDNGVLFSLPHPIEIEVAEKIIDLVPSAEMVRFGKNGSDVTSAAIRLARAFTKRDHIIVCGYHGWQDWYIGTTSRHLGVPDVVRNLSHKFVYNDMESLQSLFAEFPNQIAAVIMEPMNTAYPDPNFLQSVQELVRKNGALLVFDEVITGFRLAPGGAQELFGITPDLTTLGKGLANGYPLSAIVGRADIMALMEEVFFSFTFGGETLSLAAANIVLSKVKAGAVSEKLNSLGNYLINKVKEAIQKYAVEDIFDISGHPSWTFLQIKNHVVYSSIQIKTLFLQEVFKRGILTIGTHNLSCAHTVADINKLAEVYGEVFLLIRDVLDQRKLEAVLECQILQPVFKLR